MPKKFFWNWEIWKIWWVFMLRCKNGKKPSSWANKTDSFLNLPRSLMLTIFWRVTNFSRLWELSERSTGQIWLTKSSMLSLRMLSTNVVSWMLPGNIGQWQLNSWRQWKKLEIPLKKTWWNWSDTNSLSKYQRSTSFTILWLSLWRLLSSLVLMLPSILFSMPAGTW